MSEQMKNIELILKRRNLMTKIAWNNVHKKLPDNDRNVIVKVDCNGIITKSYDYYIPEIGEWACHKKDDAPIIEWLDLNDIPN